MELITPSGVSVVFYFVSLFTAIVLTAIITAMIVSKRKNKNL
jgi:hypothetical protein